MEAKEAKEGVKEGRALSEEALKKRKKREEKKAAEAARLAALAADPDHLDLSTPEPAQSHYDTKNASSAHTVVIPTASSSLDWYTPSSRSYSTIPAAKAAGIWEYPATLQQRARCGVFRSLWEQGYFMGGGIKFGGAYLVYPGMLRSPSYPASSPDLDQAIPCATIHISPLPFWTHPCPLSDQWRSWRMAGLAQRRRRLICSVVGMMKQKKYHTLR